MKMIVIMMLVLFVGFFSGVGQASIGGTSFLPDSSGLIFLGSGMIGAALWIRRKMTRSAK